MRFIRSLPGVAGALLIAGLLATPAIAAATDTSGNQGAGNGTQVHAPIQAPVRACGNGVAAVGAAAARCGNNDDDHDGRDRPHKPRPCPAGRLEYGKHGCATATPTSVPTNPPTSVPTNPPTNPPTGQPTGDPTGNPGGSTGEPTVPPADSGAGGGLPETGAKVGLVAGIGSGVLAVGLAVYFLAPRIRIRRQPRFTA